MAKREILFRGKRTDNGEWVQGSYVQDKEWARHGIYQLELRGAFYQLVRHEINPPTIGQFTGLKDKEGVDIYEGDKFEPDTINDEVACIIRWDDKFSKFVVDSYGYNYHIGEGSQEVYDNEISICDTIDLGDFMLDTCKVIGNIHDNPELTQQS